MAATGDKTEIETRTAAVEAESAWMHADASPCNDPGYAVWGGFCGHGKQVGDHRHREPGSGLVYLCLDLQAGCGRAGVA